MLLRAGGPSLRQRQGREHSTERRWSPESELGPAAPSAPRTLTARRAWLSRPGPPRLGAGEGKAASRTEPAGWEVSRDARSGLRVWSRATGACRPDGAHGQHRPLGDANLTELLPDDAADGHCRPCGDRPRFNARWTRRPRASSFQREQERAASGTRCQRRVGVCQAGAS